MKKPRILFLDIETRPALGYFWRMYDENISLEQMIEPSNILSVGWKWAGDRPPVRYADVWPVRSKTGRQRMLEWVHTAMSKADAICTFNGKRFDVPKLTGEFAVGGFPPLPPVAHIDVYQTTRKMGFTSNKLAHVAPLLGCGNKITTGGFRLWREYMEGDSKARTSMQRYNARDVLVLERVYKKVRPFITNHPYLGEARNLCPTCGSGNVQHRGRMRTRVFWTERLHCQACGAWAKGKSTKI